MYERDEPYDFMIHRKEIHPISLESFRWHPQEVSALPESRQDVNHWTERSFGDLVGH